MGKYKFFGMSVEKTLFEEIEISRGRIPRSRFITDIVKDELRRSERKTV